MEKLVAASPDDLNAATLYAESLMDLSPWDYYKPDGSPKPETTIALAQLERVKAADPQHPGALHFYIHAVEATPTPERAEVAADETGRPRSRSGPSRAHAGAHFLRVGRYHDAVPANELAATADEDYIAQCNGRVSIGGVLPAQPALPVYAAMMEGQ
jgi:hypothetical protein